MHGASRPHHVDDSVAARAMTGNPWSRIDAAGDGPYVLPEDRKFVEAFNSVFLRAGEKSSTQPGTYIRTDLMPEPWFGRQDAPACLLLLNSGVSEADRALHADAAFRTSLHAALLDVAAPHFHLAARADQPGRRWWSASLSTVLRTLALRDAGALRNAVSCIQLFPYHSREFGHIGVRLPSQQATIARVREQLARGAVLVVRSWTSWLGLVPELADEAHAGHVFPLTGRRVRVHPNTVGDENFRTLITAMRPYITDSPAQPTH